MSILTPKEAIDAAIAVYFLKGGNLSPREVFLKYQDLNKRFNFKDTQAFNSKTGAFIKFKSGFGVIAKGKNENEALITIRGTKGLSDWITDGNMGMQLSETSEFVHAGFNRVFNEFNSKVLSFLRQNKINTLHCVGHSLGGALATLTADAASYHGLVGDVKLYTFGSPRVGFDRFSRRFTSNVKPENIYRVHHTTDIVSVIPEWPFVHVPQPSNSYCIQGSGHNPITAHFKNNYSSSVKKMNGNTWADLPQVHIGETSNEQVKQWLSKDTVNVLSSFTLSMIGKAISLIVSTANLAVVPSMTGLDQLSYALHKAISTGKEALGLTKMLMKKIMAMVGKTIHDTVNFTASFIRWVFKLLSDAVYNMVDMAIKIDSTQQP